MSSGFVVVLGEGSHTLQTLTDSSESVLYGLTEEEIAMVEGQWWGSGRQGEGSHARTTLKQDPGVKTQMIR